MQGSGAKSIGNVPVADATSDRPSLPWDGGNLVFRRPGKAIGAPM